VDGGPVLGQRRVEVRADDTTETLRARIQAEEHQLLPAVVKQIAGQPLPLTV
jgi:phosphoribosylglycinamide formyltransferase-1